MKRLCLIQVLALFLLLSSGAYALTGLGLGARGGIYTTYNNDDLEFEGYEVIDVDQLSMIGGHFKISTLPIFTFELVGEYSWKSEDFEIQAGGVNRTVSVEVRDFMIGVNAKYEFGTPVFTPYIGGGLATHQLSYEVALNIPGVDNLVVPDDGPQFGMHALAGVKLGLPASPIEFFVEGRAGRISGDDGSTTFTMIYGGVTLSLL